VKRNLMIIALLLVSVLLVGFVEYRETAAPREPIALHWSEKEIEVRVDIPDGMSAPGGVMYLKDVPVPHYDPLQAYEDGCCVMGFSSLGQDRYDEFLENADKGIPGSIRVVYDMGDFSRVHDEEFDGEKFISRQYFVDNEQNISFEKKSTGRKLREDEFDAEGNPLDPLFNCYNHDPQAAIDDGCIVFDTEYGMSVYSFKSVLHGEELWNEFLAKVEAGTPARVRLCTLQGKWDENLGQFGEYSETEKELKVTQLEYDGRRFYTVSYNKEEGKEVCVRYNALVEGTAKRKNPSKAFTVYSLVISDEYTWEAVDRHNGRVAISSFYDYDTYILPEFTAFMK